MLIEVINIQSATKPTAKGGTYTQLDVAYRNHSNGGKVEGKKLMSFAKNDVFGIMSKALPGQKYEITSVKEGEYWQWSQAVLQNDQGTQTTSNTATVSSSVTPKSNYETAEERATRQRLIVKQSSLSSAIETLKVDKKPVDPNEVIKVAQIYCDWVFGIETPKVQSFDFDTMDDDIPM